MLTIAGASEPLFSGVLGRKLVARDGCGPLCCRESSGDDADGFTSEARLVDEPCLLGKMAPILEATFARFPSVLAGPSSCDPSTTVFSGLDCDLSELLRTSASFILPTGDGLRRFD